MQNMTVFGSVLWIGVPQAKYICEFGVHVDKSPLQQ